MGGSSSKPPKYIVNHTGVATAKLDKSYSQLMEYVHDNVIGEGVIFDGPYGKRAGELYNTCSLTQEHHHHVCFSS